MKLPTSPLTLAVGTLSMVKPSAVHTLMPLNTSLIRNGTDNVDVTSVSATFSPTNDPRPRSTTNSVNNYFLGRLSSASPVRIAGAPGQQDAKVNE